MDYTYNSTTGRLEKVTNELSSGPTTRSSFEYTYDAMSNPTRVELKLKDGDGFEYKYDDIYQMTLEKYLNSSDVMVKNIFSVSRRNSGTGGSMIQQPVPQK